MQQRQLARVCARAHAGCAAICAHVVERAVREQRRARAHALRRSVGAAAIVFFSSTNPVRYYYSCARKEHHAAKRCSPCWLVIGTCVVFDLINIGHVDVGHGCRSRFYPEHRKRTRAFFNPTLAQDAFSCLLYVCWLVCVCFCACKLASRRSTSIGCIHRAPNPICDISIRLDVLEFRLCTFSLLLCWSSFEYGMSLARPRARSLTRLYCCALVLLSIMRC